MQYIGKIMRSLDEDAVAQINNTLDSWKGLLKADTVLMHAIENQREKLLSDGSALTEFVQRYPAADIQQLRTLIRNAKKEAAENKPPKSYREIYRQLKQLMSPPSISTENSDEIDESEEADEEKS